MNVDINLHDLLSLSLYTMADDEGDDMSDTTDAKVTEAAKATTEERTKKELIVMIVQSFGLAFGFFIALIKSFFRVVNRKNGSAFMEGVREGIHGKPATPKTARATEQS